MLAPRVGSDFLQRIANEELFVGNGDITAGEFLHQFFKMFPNPLLIFSHHIVTQKIFREVIDPNKIAL